jgi:hypothetical protein
MCNQAFLLKYHLPILFLQLRRRRIFGSSQLSPGMSALFQFLLILFPACFGLTKEDLPGDDNFVLL